MNLTNSKEMKDKAYLVYVLIQYSSESITDAHRVFSSIDKAYEAMSDEIDDIQENFNIEDGKFLKKTDRYEEWCNDSGQGYSIGIEEIYVE